jgi:2-iminobutanoate/2-iminopropanoate deaminase
MATIIRTTDAPTGTPAGEFPYSQAVAAGGLLFVAGQGPFDPRTGTIVGETIEEQTRQALKNVEAILTAAGSSMERVVNVLFLLTNPDDFPGFNAEWSRWFGANPPARSGAKHPLANPDFRISLSVTAEA